MGGGDREMLIELLRSLQLSRKNREGGLYWVGPQQLLVHTPQITMEIYISDWIHKFQNKTGLDAKANLELYKSKRVCSAYCSLFSYVCVHLGVSYFLFCCHIALSLSTPRSLLFPLLLPCCSFFIYT